MRRLRVSTSLVVLIFVFIWLECADILTTLALVGRPGVVEVNPIYQLFGWLPALAAKGLFIVSASWVLWRMGLWEPLLAKVVTLLLIGGSLFVVVNNALLL